MSGPEDDDDEFHPPLPPEDRIWRHPAEVAAGLRSTESAVAPSPSAVPGLPRRQAAVFTAVGAVTSAVLVSALFLTVGARGADRVTIEPVTTVLTVDRYFPVEHKISPAEWNSEVADRVLPAVAAVDVDDRHGSAVLFRTDGLLLTSDDLVGDAAGVEVTLADGTTVKGRVLGSDDLSGLAVIEIEIHDLPGAPLGIVKAPPAVGDAAVVVPAGTDIADMKRGSLSATSGKIKVSTTLNLHGLLQLDQHLPERGSGAALVDASGSVIGIVVDVGTRYATHAVPIGWARKIAEDILVWGEARHPWLGVLGADLDASSRAELGVSGGIRVETVIADGPADRAGVERGDVITSIDGQPVATMSELILQLRRHAPDSVVEVVIDDGSEPRRVPVRLGLRTHDGTD